MNAHLVNVTSTINFLSEYKKIIEKTNINYCNNLDVLIDNSNSYMNSYIESLYDIIDCSRNINITDKISKILDENRQTKNNIIEIMPIILCYFANKYSKPYTPWDLALPLCLEDQPCFSAGNKNEKLR